MLELSCDSDTDYHWCYWEHGDQRYSTSTDDNDEVTELFTWVRSSTTCGISINSAQDVHQGKFGWWEKMKLIYPILRRMEMSLGKHRFRGKI